MGGRLVFWGLCVVLLGVAQGKPVENDDAAPTRHPYVQCKIDLYDCIQKGKDGKLECLEQYKTCMAVLIPTVPPSVIACKDALAKCVSVPGSGMLEKAKCFKIYAECLVKTGSTQSPPADTSLFLVENDDVAPTRHPFVQCKIDFYNCIKEGKDGKLECLRKYKNCMATLIPTLPPVVIVCKDIFKKCLNVSSGLDKLSCFKIFKDCFKTAPMQRRSADASPTLHPFLQCKTELFQCMKKGTGNMECLKEYKNCVAPLVPTLPPAVGICKFLLKTCIDHASGFVEKAKCFKVLKNCWRDPTNDQVPADEPLDDVDPTRGPFAQCQIDLYDCINAGNDKLECLKKYKDCMVVLLPTVPPHVRNCANVLSSCVDDSSSLSEKWQCTKDFMSCLSGPVATPYGVLADVRRSDDENKE